MAHGIHRVVRLVAVDRPIAQMVRRELIGAHRADRNVDADLGPLRAFRHPAAVGAGDLEIIAVHVDRVVCHRQVSDAHPYPVALVHDQRINIGENPAVPGP